MISQNIKQKKIIKPMSTSEFTLIGIYLSKIDFWSHKKGYKFSFQFWGENNNNVYIDKEDVEIASFGGEDTPLQILTRACLWAEQANPRIKYPSHLEISNFQP